jgi:hypothetical protein
MTVKQMNIKAPNSTDLTQLLSAIQSFPLAWGSINERGEHRPLIADPRISWVMVKSNAQQHSTLWRVAGISTEPTSAFAEMQAATDHTILLHLFKFKRGLFGSVWAADVVLIFDDKQVMVGAIGAPNQPALWDRFRALCAGRGETLNSVQEAADAV